MAAWFVDLDGTVFQWGTEEPLPGAIEQLLKWQDRGDQVIFVTQRNGPWARVAQHALQSLGIFDPIVLSNISSPRTVINDQGACAINHEKNAPWVRKEP